ncbi:MAG: TRAP transporter substrate-binding protein [Clostridia bacterium]|nr:TRAP transporter substrate-binding protein [Clostridia bacterium]
MYKTQELEIVDMVKTGTIQVGTTGGAATTVFPELSVFLLPYLFRDYDHAYKVLNGDIGREYAKLIEDKYGLHVLFFYDYGFRQFWNTKRPITKPDDLKGLKMRVQQGQVFVDTVNGLGASAVPMSWSEVIPAVQQGVVDGADLPVVNIDALKVYEVAKYASMTSHNFGPAVAVVNKAFWSGLSDEERKLIEELASEAQRRTIEATSGADAKARELLEPKGMQVNFPDLEPFRKVAQEKVWPKYREQYGQVIDRITQVR